MNTTRPAWRAVQTASTSLSGSGTGSTVNVPAASSAASAGSSSTIARVETEPWPEPTMRRPVARRAALGIAAVGARDGADLDPLDRAGRCGWPGRSSSARRARPTGSRARRRPRGLRAACRARLRSPRSRRGAGRSGTAIRPALPFAPRTSTRAPGRKSIRRRSAIHADIAGFMPAASTAGIGVRGHAHAAPTVDERVLGHRPQPRVRQDEVHELAVLRSGPRRRCQGSAGARRCSCSASRPRTSARAGAGRTRGPRPAARGHRSAPGSGRSRSAAGG